MKLKPLLKDIEISEINAPMELEIGDVRYSSRDVKPGDLFVAVPGYATDGHKYIPDAVRRGAAVVLCERDMPENVPWVRVRSSREALSKLGANWYGDPSEKMQVIGVTGTNGKTSVTYLLKALLENAVGAKVGLIGTICNMIGDEVIPTERTTPESFELQGLLARMAESGCTHVVMEVSSHALYLHRAANIHFRVGAFTNLTEDHLDFHGTMENYGRAKAILFRNCERGVFNADDPASKTMIDGSTCSVYTVGVESNADLQAEKIALCADHVAMDVCEGSQRAHLRIGIPGRFTVSNALIAMGIARQLDIPLDRAAQALCLAKPVKGRIEIVPTPGKNYTVLIDYAHTPDGLEKVLRSVRDFCRGRLLVLFGCGGDRDRAKRPIMGEIAMRLADYVIVTTDNPRTEAPLAIINDIITGIKRVPDWRERVLIVPERREAIRAALHAAQKDDVIVLAGKGHETYQIIGTKMTHLDEREEVAAALCETEE